MNIESPSINPKDVRVDNELKGLGYQPVEGYKAQFYQETTADGEIIDHMLLISDMNPNFSAGLFKLKRSKISNLTALLEETQTTSHLVSDSSAELQGFKEIDPDCSVVDVRKNFESQGIRQEDVSARFYKWHDGRIHTVIIDEIGQPVGVYKLDPKRASSVAEYFKEWKPLENAFEENRQEYGDDVHP